MKCESSHARIRQHETFGQCRESVVCNEEEASKCRNNQLLPAQKIREFM